MARPAQAHPFSLPLILGHEIAGVVSAVGRGVGGVREGDSVVVYGPWGCGGCRNCVMGAENLCLFARRGGMLPPGLGADGGLAEQVLVPSARHVVRTNLPSVQAAPFADAGLTAFAAARRALVALSPGGIAVVVGVGGLGHAALQVMAELACATVIASDTSLAARELALRCGAELAVHPEDLIDTIQEVTRGAGVDVVLDFVATDLTLATGAGALSPGGHLILVGLGPGAIPVSVDSVPLGATVATVYWGSRQELLDVLQLGEAGKFRSRSRPLALRT